LFKLVLFVVSFITIIRPADIAIFYSENALT